MTRPGVPLLSLVVLVGALLTACGGSASGDGRAADRPAEPRRPAAASAPATTEPAAGPSDGAGEAVYVAVGASETVGVGADRPTEEAWPRVLHDTALRETRYVNVGVSGSTVSEALSEQLPQALAADPDVVTVWLAVNDITHLVPVEAYEQQLRTLVHALRQDGRTEVLVANVPPVQDLPAYRACLPGAANADDCSLPVVPSEAQVVAVVDDFNAAVDRVVRAEGAVLVDVSDSRDLARLTSADGFHPSTRGHRLVARSFAHALEG
jgi:acyl-CoA thioesterase I